VRFEEPVGHAAAIARLWNAARGDRLAHALCFAGPAGIGKFLAAEWLALGLVCRTDEPGRVAGPPCGICGPCKRARAGTHPDVFVIDLESENRARDAKDREEEIRVHRIARRSQEGDGALADFLALRAAEGGLRIVLVREADRANEEAQNALLKTLEEPGSRTLIVLETARREMLLPTIQSRCVRVELQAPEASATARILAQRGLSPAEAEALARWSGGAPGLAQTLHARGAVALRSVLERVLSGALDAFTAAAEVGEIEGDFRSKTALGGERVRARAFLDLALAVLRDRERAVAGLAVDQLPHGDLALGIAAPRAGRRAWQLEQCLRARQDVEHNLAPEALLERALLALDPVSASTLAAC
jgi:DNA polymerase-3 subunit delta'